MQKLAVATGYTQPEPIQVSVQTNHVSQIRELLEKSRYVELTSSIIAKSKQGVPFTLGFQGNENSQIKTLIELFFIGKPVDQDIGQKALHPVSINNLVADGLIEAINGQVIPLVKFTPYRDLLLITDFEWASEAVSHRESVMGITGSSQFLANVTVRRPSRLTLDLGTGTGVQALMAARHSEKVIGVDLSSRALEFARFNAQLNGFDNIVFVQGDLFEPVENLSFDLIVSNPPFLISPENHCLYRDNPLDGDEFVRGIVSEMPRYLNRGGFGQVVCNWIQPENKDWVDRVNGWFRKSGCDGWIIRQSESEPEKYAHGWLKDFKSKAMDERQKAWLKYYKQNGIASIGFGLITLRRGENTPHWSRVEKSLPGMTLDSGGYINHIFQIQDFLNQNRQDQALLNQQFRVCPYMRIDRQSVPVPGGSWTTVLARLVLTQGFLFQVDIDNNLLEAIQFCNPEITLGKLLRKIAIRKGKSPDEFISTYLPACRKLIGMGFLWPANSATDCLNSGSPEFESENIEIGQISKPENSLLNNEFTSTALGRAS